MALLRFLGFLPFPFPFPWASESRWVAASFGASRGGRRRRRRRRRRKEGGKVGGRARLDPARAGPHLPGLHSGRLDSPPGPNFALVPAAPGTAARPTKSRLPAREPAAGAVRGGARTRPRRRARPPPPPPSCLLPPPPRSSSSSSSSRSRPTGRRGYCLRVGARAGAQGPGRAGWRCGPRTLRSSSRPRARSAVVPARAEG